MTLSPRLCTRHGWPVRSYAESSVNAVLMWGYGKCAVHVYPMNRAGTVEVKRCEGVF